MVKYLVETKEDANRMLRVAWAIAKGRIYKPYESAVKDLLDFRDSLKESGFWWQAQRVEKAFHYLVKVRSQDLKGGSL